MTTKLLSEAITEPSPAFTVDSFTYINVVLEKSSE